MDEYSSRLTDQACRTDHAGALGVCPGHGVSPHEGMRPCFGVAVFETDGVTIEKHYTNSHEAPRHRALLVKLLADLVSQHRAKTGAT